MRRKRRTKEEWKATLDAQKANGLVPYDYIVYLLEAFTHPAPDIEQLLPWNVKLSIGLQATLTLGGAPN